MRIDDESVDARLVAELIQKVQEAGANLALTRLGRMVGVQADFTEAFQAYAQTISAVAYLLDVITERPLEQTDQIRKDAEKTVAGMRASIRAEMETER